MLMSSLKKFKTLYNSSRNSRINLNISIEIHINDLQHMLSDQLYKFYNLDIRILMTYISKTIYIHNIIPFIFANISTSRW